MPEFRQCYACDDDRAPEALVTTSDRERIGRALQRQHLTGVVIPSAVELCPRCFWGEEPPAP